ncbi:hypothetical protein VNO78_26496 [Psophocarpus tetragonolobus]|uniref:Uncharacterized protein n=1 Tax=Psophocarpus tetragonolobus TaxID=3891 RepID=A0AAN9RZI4_PSOTE
MCRVMEWRMKEKVERRYRTGNCIGDGIACKIALTAVVRLFMIGRSKAYFDFVYGILCGLDNVFLVFCVESCITKMPIEAYVIIWGALLNASWFWKDMEVRQRAAEKLFGLDPNPIFTFVVLSNMYAIPAAEIKVRREKMEKTK